MCIIVFKPENVSVDCETLRICYESNPDGAGYMFPCEGGLLIKKGFFTFDDFHAAWEKTQKIYSDELPVIFHFRIATAGRIDKTNCHPHRIARDLGFVHNGILSFVKVPKHGKLSDTIIYRDRYLSTLIGQSLHNDKLFGVISTHIGINNKFVFMNGKGEVVICNEEQGLWENGLWFSNTSFRSRKYFPFLSMVSGGACEYCGNILHTPEELAEGACLKCLAYFDPDYAECGGCHNILPSNSHKAAGWCDACGSEIYGRNWPEMLHEAEDYSEKRLADYF